MKSPLKLQEKLRILLKVNHDLRLRVPILPMTDRELRDAAWVVEAYLQSKDDVINSDPLKEWLEEYRFFLADQKGG